jgi:4-hydroxy-tetrahydrodipicolinate reductase
MPHDLPDRAAASPAPVPVAIFGKQGLMARALAERIANTPDMVLVATLPARDAAGVELITALTALPARTVVCDFTHPEAHARLLHALARVPLPLVTGTSGLSEADEARLKEFSAQTAVMRGRNFSLGAVMARLLIERLAQLSGQEPQWQAAVLDFHHARKLDAESATARDWAAAWQEPHPHRTAPVTSIRLGNGVSEHSLIAAGNGERVEIAHRLLSLDAPLSGVLAGIRFVAARPCGLFEPLVLLDRP